MDRARKVPTLEDLDAWVEVGVYGDEREARVEAFDAVPIDVASFWT